MCCIGGHGYNFFGRGENHGGSVFGYGMVRILSPIAMRVFGLESVEMVEAVGCIQGISGRRRLVNDDDECCEIGGRCSLDDF